MHTNRPEFVFFLILSFCAFLNVIIILIKENKKKLTLCQNNEKLTKILWIWVNTIIDMLSNLSLWNSNIIIEGLFWKRKDYFTWKKFERQKNNFIDKFYFWPNFFSYRFLPNFKKLCDSNKSWLIFSEKRFPTTSPFPIFKNKFFNGWNY